MPGQFAMFARSFGVGDNQIAVGIPADDDLFSVSEYGGGTLRCRADGDFQAVRRVIIW